MLERLVDALAAKLGLDPAEVRRRNFIPPFQDGHDVVTGLTYDSGDYPAILAKLLDHANYDELRAEQKEARAKGRYIGLGLSTYVEICGLGPSQVAGAIGFQGGLWESSIIRFHPTGKVHVFIGASPHGQGEETTFAQIVAGELGVSPEDVKVVHGDTDSTPMGWGTYGSRTTAVGGAALTLTARKIREKAKIIAAHMLEAAVEDMDYDDGKFFVKGSPDKRQDHPRHRPASQCRLEPARRRRGRPGSLIVLRSAQLRLPLRRAPGRRGGRSRDRPRRAETLHRHRRLRPADQSRHRRGPGPRRRRAGCRPGACGKRPPTTRMANC